MILALGWTGVRVLRPGGSLSQTPGDAGPAAAELRPPFQFLIVEIFEHYLDLRLSSCSGVGLLSRVT
jgi:hypothetical protein